MMMLVLLSVLFICGLLNSLFYFSPSKLFAWLLSLFPKSPPLPPVGLTKKIDRAELEMVFATFDHNGNGFITKQELEESLEKLGLFTGDKQVAAMIEQFDSNGDGLIDLHEFCELYESMMGKQGEEEKEGKDDYLKEAFDVFDENGDGLITVEELALVLTSLGLKQGMGMEECRKMISKVDMDGDGMVNFKEFKRMMASGSLIPVS
ncbi:calmodulin-like protein 3 [Magnolia sinica]|uniref:calmodulin-like protein 3 n=1 Tax=Magnolia sinica TaxID=86752 RepID=UPI002657B926|nr:calmodulin-like protein 3 [Magnolia sinica]XP_058115536.1 calmodulin-like protein 3 [Magnolia sinica]